MQLCCKVEPARGDQLIVCNENKATRGEQKLEERAKVLFKTKGKKEEEGRGGEGQRIHGNGR